MNRMDLVSENPEYPGSDSNIIHKIYPRYGEAHIFHYPDPID